MSNEVHQDFHDFCEHYYSYLNGMYSIIREYSTKEIPFQHFAWLAYIHSQEY